MSGKKGMKKYPMELREQVVHGFEVVKASVH